MKLFFTHKEIALKKKNTTLFKMKGNVVQNNKVSDMTISSKI